jgi:hypothetical protein
MKTTIWVYASKEYLFNIAKKLNLGKEATAMFIYAQEYEVEIEVDQLTGDVKPLNVK